MIGGAVALVPWVLYVSLTLPVQYEAHNWRYTWVGFDLFLAALMALTAYCGWATQAGRHAAVVRHGRPARV